jgi:hypothetical protein
MTDSKPQSPASQWVQSLRASVIKRKDRHLARVAHVGFVMATYANADGTSIRVGQPTLATLTGMSVETVSRAQQVMVGVQILRAKRRPNKTTEYILSFPSEPPDWDGWLPIFTATRQKEAHRKKKAAELEAALAAVDTVRGGVPDTVHGRIPEQSDTVHGRGTTPSMDGVRTPSVAGGTMSYLPPVATSTEDLETGPHSPQPQVRVGTRGESDFTGEERWGCGTKRCARCEARMANRSDRIMCVACMREETRTAG